MATQKNISPVTIKEVKKILPGLRKEVEKKMKEWNRQVLEENFYSDEEVINELPFAAYNYYLVKTGIHIDKETILEFLNDQAYKEVLPQIVANALRFMQSSKL